MNPELIAWALRVAGLGLFALAAASTQAPKALGWKTELASLRPLTRQIFTTQAAYILAINVLMGLLAVAAPGLLLDRTPLAAIVSGFICVYWALRFVLQLVYFDASDAPKGLKYKVAEWGFLALFLYFSAAFGWAAAFNLLEAP
ncbi:MAG: hypothetical protein ICCCNLDF_02453 [Planctomycetes bacterium]|nr:hypothetical protein [Planctomycetota bacterium]